MNYDIRIEWGENNCSAYAPSLPGCVATGKTIADTAREMREAIAFHLDCMREDGDKIPRPKRGETGAAFLEIPAYSVSGGKRRDESILVPVDNPDWVVERLAGVRDSRFRSKKEKTEAFSISLGLRNIGAHGKAVKVSDVPVFESPVLHTWIAAESLHRAGIMPIKKRQRLLDAKGRPAIRDVGFALLSWGPWRTIDEVVFAHGDDPLTLGARTLEGLNVRVDAARKKLVAARPILVA
jgi:predicted RNase H-like HicB family nuclease